MRVVKLKVFQKNGRCVEAHGLCRMMRITSVVTVWLGCLAFGAASQAGGLPQAARHARGAEYSGRAAPKRSPEGVRVPRERSGVAPVPSAPLAVTPRTTWIAPPRVVVTPAAAAERTLERRGHSYALTARSNGFYYSAAQGYWHPVYGWWNQVGHCWGDPDGDPPGPRRDDGAHWENPPGLLGGVGVSPDHFGQCR